MIATRLTRAVLAFVVGVGIVLAGEQTPAQDFQSLLTAVDKLETRLKSLVQKETASRRQQMAAMERRFDDMAGVAANAEGSTVIEQLQDEISQLRTAIESLESGAGIGASVAIDRQQLAALADDVHALQAAQQASREDVESLWSRVGGNGRNLAAAGGATAAAPMRKYNNLRFKDVYRNLREVAAPDRDFFDPLKRMDLGGGWTATLGGQYRFRYESDNNRKLGATDPSSQQVMLNRLFLHADLQFANHLRLFGEFKYAGLLHNDLAPGPGSRDKPDIENLFADGWLPVGQQVRMGLRLGRQELQFGKQRLVSPLDWANTRRTFDGVRVMAKGAGWTVDGFFTRPVKVDPEELNTADDTKAFFGAYAGRNLGASKISAYYLVLTKNDDNPLTAGLAGDYEYHTVGMGFDGKQGSFDWSTEAAYQFGDLGDKQIAAYMLSLSGGVTATDVGIKPRFGVGFDVASGDGNASDSTVRTFNQLFPLGHAYFGWADQVGRRNVRSTRMDLSAKPHKRVLVKFSALQYRLAESQDALYNAGGKATRSDATGASGKDIGSEIDGLIKVNLGLHASLHLGIARFFPGDFLRETGPAKTHTLYYVMMPLKF